MSALRGLLLLAPLAVFAPGAHAQAGYKRAPAAVRELLGLPPSPTVRLTPGGDGLLVLDRQEYPSIDELSRPYLRLAGLRIDPVGLGPRLPPRYTRLIFQPLDGGKPAVIDKEKDWWYEQPVWSPDGKHFAISVVVDGVRRLYIGFPGKGIVPFATRLNACLTQPIRWTPDSKYIVCLEGPGPEERVVKKPAALPVIQETTGKPGPVPTYQDLLRDKHDERLFGLHTTSQVKLVLALNGKAHTIGTPGSIASVSVSPGGKYLLVATIHKPYSYSVPVSYFPLRTEVWGLDGKVVQKVADLPLADKVPIQGVRTGKRSIHWHPVEPATLVWAEALDGGDPGKKGVPHRDEVFLQKVGGKPVSVFKTEHRFTGIQFSDTGFALVSEYEREKRRRRTWHVFPGKDTRPRLVFDLAVQDRYADPGAPLLKRLPTGKRVLRVHDGALFLVGAGASPKGSRPFLDRFDLKSLEATRLFRSAADCYEAVVDVMNEDGSKFLTRHESPTSPPNWRVRQKGKEAFRAVTDYKDRAPELRKITRRLVRYKRADGTPMSFTLYLPPGYKEGTKLPTVVWAYPREYTSSRLAGQVAGSPNRYLTITGSSHLFFVLAGYAVLDGASMPIVGSAEKANDTFVEQVVASGKAAIDKGVELGVVDPERVGVAGHSYGAFMTANLLAHSDLFRAGIARSGAYNRTLTPFGFQNERRTFWQAPQVYLRMSPFVHADKIKAPLLLIHGADDNNSGTFPIQSARLYAAIRGNGGTARYVSLPHESHGYAARESVEHTVAEMIEWFDRHVKNAKPRKGKK